MKKNTLLNAILISILLLSFSCNEKEEVAPDVVPSNEAKSIDATQNVLYTGDTKYSKIFNRYPIVGYTSVRENSLADEEMNMRNELERFATKSTNVSVKINGKPVNSILTKSGIPNDLYGEKVTFEVDFPINTKGESGENSTIVTEMYIPDLVRITSPAIETEAELYPYCYYKDFLLKWNHDQSNENGLVVMVEWHGATLDGIEAKTVRNIDVIPYDNGFCVLNNKIFDNIR